MAKVSTLSGRVTLPGQRDYEPIRAMLRAGKTVEAIGHLAGVVLARPDEVTAKELLFDAFTERREFPAALVLAEDLLKRNPASRQYLKYVTFTLSNMKRFTEAIAHATRYLAEHGEEVT